jgi:hypothetical protein
MFRHLACLRRVQEARVERRDQQAGIGGRRVASNYGSKPHDVSRALVEVARRLVVDLGEEGKVWKTAG